MAEERTQKDIIESEMVQLIRELNQLKKVRDGLDAQKEFRTVGDYMLEGGVAGRIFMRRTNYSGDCEPYRVVGFYEQKSGYPASGPGFAMVQFVDNGLKKDFPVSYLLGDREVSLQQKPAQ